MKYKFLMLIVGDHVQDDHGVEQIKKCDKSVTSNRIMFKQYLSYIQRIYYRINK